MRAPWPARRRRRRCRRASSFRSRRRAAGSPSLCRAVCRRETGTPAMISSSASASTIGAAGLGRRSVNSLKKRRRHQFDAFDARELVGGHQRAVVVERGELAEAFLAQQRQVDREGEAAEAGIGADVARRLFAADVLFARRERQHVAAAAFGVDGFAGRGGPASGGRISARAAKRPT